jgi:hypothetical protein
MLTRYRLRSSQKNVVFDSGRIVRQGWKPEISLHEGFDGVVASELKKRGGTYAGEAGTQAADVIIRSDAEQLPEGPRSTR